MKLLLFLLLCLCVEPALADIANPPFYGFKITFIRSFYLITLSCTSCLVMALLLHFYVKKKVSKRKFFWCLFIPCLCIVCLIIKAESDIRFERLCYHTAFNFADDPFDDAPIQYEAAKKACEQQYWQFKVLNFFNLK